jgi:predicted transcriptional regulator of viral defense system
LLKIASLPIIDKVNVPSLRIPPALVGLGRRVVRPRDGAAIYRNPQAEFRRMADRGFLRRIAHGYYLIPELGQLDDPSWRPPVEHLALGVAVADHEDRAALMGLSAARHHGAHPRAHATAWVAIEATRRPLDCGPFGLVVFVPRDLDRLDLVRAHTPLADGWVTSIEQTVVDLARRPDYAGGQDLAQEALSTLWPQADKDLVAELAQHQRGRAALERLRKTLPDEVA